MSKNCPNKEKAETFNTCYRTSENVSEKRCLDSGATPHLCSDMEHFNNVNKNRIGKLDLVVRSILKLKAEKQSLMGILWPKRRKLSSGGVKSSRIAHGHK